MTLAAPPKRGTVSPNLVSLHGELFDRKTGFLAQYNVEREEQIELLGLSLISGIDPLFLGDPGVGKTWMIELMLMCLNGTSDKDFFNTLVFKETPADDILGPRSLPGMKAGRIERLSEGYLPTAVVGYLDEIFKSSPTLVNSLLDLFANRKLKVGANIIDCSQLLCIFGSSNELPDREDMLPFRDRFGLTNFVPAVRSPEGRIRVMRIQDEFQSGGSTIDLSNAPRLSLDDVRTMRQEVTGIILPDSLIESMNKAQERWASAGHPPSQRRIGQMLKAIKARAWIRGSDHATTDDMIVCQHMAWNQPDDAKSAHDIIMEFANVFARKASRTREALEPILAKLDEVKADIGSEEPSEDQMAEAFKVMRDLRRMKRETKDQIDQGTTQGHDVTDLEAVMSTISDAYTWVEKTMTGEEGDEN